MLTILTPKMGGMAKIKRGKGKRAKAKGKKNLYLGLHIFNFPLAPLPFSRLFRLAHGQH
jgi:hypothetical protein